MAKAEFKTIEASPRELSKKANRELRAQKKVPAVLYGPEVNENLHFSVDELDLERILRTQQTKLVELTFDGKVYKTLLKRAEFDPVTDRPVHVDFYVLSNNHKVTLRIPVTVTGNSRGVIENGGRLFQPMKFVRIRVLPEFIPAEFIIDITSLDIGSSIHVGDLDLDGINPIDDLGRTIVTIRPPKGEDFLDSLTADVPEDEEAIEGEELAEGETPEDGEGAEGEGSEEEKTEE
ncbi:MAG: 50S ribosomal protein L25 [Balneola sp.]